MLTSHVSSEVIEKGNIIERVHCYLNVEDLYTRPFFLFLFSLISLIADGPSHYHLACSH